MSLPPDDQARLRCWPCELPDGWRARLCEFLQTAWDAGLSPSVRDFVAALPELDDEPDILLDLIALHRLLRTEAGDEPTTADYAADFPTHAPAIRELFDLEECVLLREADPDATTSHPPSLPPPLDDDDDRPPVLPARFRYVRWLGAGGYGRVCECVDRKYADRRVALKLLHECGGNSNERQRFKREAQVAANLNHPFLCTLHEFDFAHDPPFLVLELIEGDTLRALLDVHGRLSIRDAATIIRDAAAALDHCHEHGVVHRDLKPENIMRRKAGSVVKVLDLGMVRRLALTPEHWASAEGTMAGTMPYYSPEHFACDPQASSDQFSLGIVLYESLTGRRPFLGDTIPELHRAIVTGTPASPRSLRPEIDPTLTAIVLRMLAKNPDRRFASMADVQRALDGWLGRRPRSTRWKLAAAGAAAVLFAGGGLTWRQLAEPPPVVVLPLPQPPAQDLPAVLQRIVADLSGLPVADQEFQRWFRLGHLEGDERIRTRAALERLLTPLAVNGSPEILKDVNGDGSLLRWDLRTVDWRADVQWRALMARCPLSLHFNGVDLPPAGGTIFKLQNSDFMPSVNADWFVAAVSAEPLLGELAGTAAAERVRIDEPLTEFRESYNGTPVDLRRAAAELGLPSDEPLRGLLEDKPEITQRLELTAWLTGGTVPRERWNRADLGDCPAAELATALKLGIRRIVGSR